MPDIDPSKIKPGDTVRVRYSNAAMVANGVEPFEFTSVVYRGIAVGDMHVGSVRIGHPALTILEHTPARPDWADALVVRDKDGLLHLADADRGGFNCQNGARWPVADMRSLEPITVVIDADGNPPEHEPEWLDADALDKLPDSSIILPKVGPPRVRHFDDWFNIPGGIGVRCEHLDPARLLWTPEAGR